MAEGEGEDASARARRQGILAGLGVVVCWTGFNLVSRLGAAGGISPLDLGALRYGVSGLIALPFLLWTLRPGSPDRTHLTERLLRYLILATVGGLGYGLLVYTGFSLAPGAHAGVLVNGGIPLWTVVLGTLVFRARVSRPLLIALGLSSAGLLMMAGGSFLGHHGEGVWLGDLCFFLSAATWAVFGLLVRHWGIPASRAVAGIAVGAMVLFEPVYFLWLPQGGLAQLSLGSLLLQGTYQGFIAPLIAAGLFSFATHRLGPPQAAMLLALVPATTAVSAALLLGETVTVSVVGGVVLVSLGAILGARTQAGAGRVLQGGGGAKEGARRPL